MSCIKLLKNSEINKTTFSELSRLRYSHGLASEPLQSQDSLRYKKNISCHSQRIDIIKLNLIVDWYLNII